jgi:hypothetical protein
MSPLALASLVSSERKEGLFLAETDPAHTF